MKKTFDLLATEKVWQSVEVEFPVFRKHDVSGDDYSSVIYTRITLSDSTGKMIEVNIHVSDGRNDGYELEIVTDYHFDGSGIDYLLGRGAYESGAGEFNAKLAELKAAIDAVEKGGGG